MAKGKWAQGIRPRAFQWIIKDQLAICERPGGYGTNHRRVRRQEEVIWIRENGFSFVVSLLPSDHNLHSYDEQGMPWKHWSFAPSLDLEVALPQLYTELQTQLGNGKKLLLHMDEVGDRLTGLMAGYLRWTGMVPVTFEAITVMENILGHQLGPAGRAIVAAAETSLTADPPKPEVDVSGDAELIGRPSLSLAGGTEAGIGFTNAAGVTGSAVPDQTCDA